MINMKKQNKTKKSTTHPGTTPWFLACISLMICAFRTTGFPGAIFSPSRYRTVVENFDWVLMTCGGCFSTTRELRDRNSYRYEETCFLLSERHHEWKFYGSLWVKEKSSWGVQVSWVLDHEWGEKWKWVASTGWLDLETGSSGCRGASKGAT